MQKLTKDKKKLGCHRLILVAVQVRVELGDSKSDRKIDERIRQGKVDVETEVGGRGGTVE